MKLSSQQDFVQESFKEGGLLSQKFDGYKIRPQQVELAESIQDSVRNKKPLLGEAPTGVGKSLSALIPAFEHIVKTGEPVIVVTSSIVLQEQYYNKDIPLLEEIFDYDARPVLIKGRGNYLCKQKHQETKVNTNVGMTNTNHQEEYQKIQEWAEETETGDMSELDFVPKYPVWSQFAAIDNHECARKECPLFEQCFYYNQRRSLMSSKLVICNYHYFFNAMNQEKMLPEGARVVVMDEGHEIAGIARDFQEKKYNIRSLNHIMNNFKKQYKKAHASQMFSNLYSTVEGFQLDLVKTTLASCIENISKFFYENRPSDRDAWTMDKEKREEVQSLVTPHYEQLVNSISAIKLELMDNGLDQEQRNFWRDLHEEEEIQWQVAQENLLDGLQEKCDFVEEFFNIEPEEDGDELFFGGDTEGEGSTEKQTESVNDTIIHWMEPFDKETSVSLHIKPSMAADFTSQLFHSEWVPIILSATLSTNQSFDHLKADLGIGRDVDNNEVIVSSPFPLEENMMWYLPKEMPDGNTKEHQQAMLKEMKRIAEALDGRTLCLFTSNKNLRAATDYFRKEAPTYIDVISQLDWPKQQIIDHLKNHPNTIVVATRSLFTGIDIQGQNLSAVLIDKLPFPMIGDPVNDYLTSMRRGFWTFTLPETIITMKQGFGRLNRTSEDRGIVGVMDGRLATSGYKNRIFNSFDFKVKATRSFDDVKAYAESILEGRRDELNGSTH